MFLLNNHDEDLATIAYDNFEKYGVFPRCRKCHRDCKQYNANGLVRLVCPESKDYSLEAERLTA
jgi:hypothetical protein